MIGYARTSWRGNVAHMFIVEREGQMIFRTVCGIRKRWDQPVNPKPDAKICKTCVRVYEYDNSRPRPVYIRVPIWKDRRSDA